MHLFMPGNGPRWKFISQTTAFARYRNNATRMVNQASRAAALPCQINAW
jgi:hypothetical protein